VSRHTTVHQDPAAFGATQEAPAAQRRGGLAPGHVFDGKYAVERLLGTGGAGSVYAATHVLLRRKVAIKVLHGVGLLDAHRRERLLHEGRNLASVVHPHIVQVFDLGIAGDVPYLVMEHLEGGTLEDHLLRTGRLPLRVAFAVAHQMLLGIAAAHDRGLVHRDLKPANVLLVEAGDGAVHVKILDFGISTAVAAAERSDFVVGTPGYLAPEQARGEPVDPRTDLYGFAATMYEAITGQPVFSAPDVAELLRKVCHAPPLPPAELRPELPAALNAALLRALAKDPADRFPSARDLLAACDFGAAARGEPARYVLIAEPDRSAAARCHAIAAELGRPAVFARDGVEALDVVRTMGAPELALLNLSLPRLDGFAVLRGLAEEAPGRPISAVVASPFRSLRDAAWAARDDLGVHYVLSGLGDEEAVRAAMLAVFEGVPSMRRAARPAAPFGPRDEQGRLQRLHALGLDAERPPLEALQQLVTEVAEAARVPVALVSIVTRDRQSFHAEHGLQGELREKRWTPRDWAFCDHVVEGRQSLVVPDARKHPVFSSNPLVTQGLVGGYAGVPVVSSTGDVLGTLCLIDSKPLDVGPEVVDALCALARRVGGELELAAPAAPPPPATRSGAPPSISPSLPSVMDDESIGTSPGLAELLSDPKLAVVVLDERRRVVDLGGGAAALLGVPSAQARGLGREDFLRRVAPGLEDPADFLRRAGALPVGPFVAYERFALRGPPRRALAWCAKPLHTPQGTWHIETFRAE
jgi:CheY-like chemotaxis protein